MFQFFEYNKEGKWVCALPMLTVEQCRKALGQDSDLSADKLSRIRNELYAAAEVILDQLAAMHVTPHFSLVDLAPKGYKDRVEERAAIMEYDGDMPRQDAEREAVLSIYRNNG